MNRVKNKNQLSMQYRRNKGKILLSVVVSCKSVEKILKKNLRALSRQNLTPELWIPVFIFKEEQKHSPCVLLVKNYFPSGRFLFLPEGQPLYEMRNLALDHLNSSYIYFIDEDVILDDPQHLSRLIEFYKTYPEWTVIGGSYLNHPDSSFWGRSYNWTVCLWTKNHPGFIPAGNLSVTTNPPFYSRFYSPSPFGFGGEESCFLKSLQKEGRKSLLDEALSASHLAGHDFKNFVKRAWVHGASLAFERQIHSSSQLLFFKEPAPFFIKTAALFYLLLVRFSCLFYKVGKVLK